MGYQESIIICKNKEELSKALDILYRITKFTDDIDIYGIGRFKEIYDQQYFIYIGGERYPYQTEKMIRWTVGKLIYIEYVLDEYTELFDDIDFDIRFTRQENEMIHYIDITDYKADDIVIETL